MLKKLGDLAETVWYGLMMGITHRTLVHLGYIEELSLGAIIFVFVVTFLIGDHVIARNDRWLIRRKVKKDVIQALLKEGLNPKDFTIEFSKNITANEDGNLSQEVIVTPRKKD